MGRAAILLTQYVKVAHGLLLIIFCVIFLTTLTGCSASRAPSIPAFSILDQPFGSNKLIVFVHGFTGGHSTTWTNQSGASWADFIKEDKQLREFTVWSHNYDTPLLKRSLTVEETATRFLQQLTDNKAFDRFEEIYLVAHSMGGIVVKSALVALNLETETDRLSKVRAVLFISTPHQGSRLAQLGTLFSSNPQIRDMEDANFNSYLQSLDSQWWGLMRNRGNRAFPKSYVAYETKPTLGIVIVDRVSALTSHDDEMFPVAADHRDIVKPRDAQSDIYRWVRSRLLDTSRLVRSATQAAVSVQVAPRVLHYILRFKTGGETMQQNEYGFGLVVRVRNTGEKIERIRSLEITGDITTDPGDPTFLVEGKTMDEIDAEYGERQPYYRVSFVFFPQNANKIEPGSEEVFRFVALDPTYLSTRVISRGEEDWKYVGFRAKTPRAPFILTTVPRIDSFVTFTSFRHAVPGNAELLGPRLRNEIKSGTLKFTLRFESGSRDIDPVDIQSPNLILWEYWNKATTQDIFYKNNPWDRVAPVHTDPLVESNP